MEAVNIAIYRLLSEYTSLPICKYQKESRIYHTVIPSKNFFSKKLAKLFNQTPKNTIIQTIRDLQFSFPILHDQRSLLYFSIQPCHLTSSFNAHSLFANVYTTCSWRPTLSYKFNILGAQYDTSLKFCRKYATPGNGDFALYRDAPSLVFAASPRLSALLCGSRCCCGRGAGAGSLCLFFLLTQHRPVENVVVGVIECAEEKTE